MDDLVMPFDDETASAWAATLGRLRDVVRQTLVASQLAELVPDPSDGPLRVIDVGCGQGTQALALARAGCRVTGLDRSTDLLDRFRAALAAEPLAVRERVHLMHGRGDELSALQAAEQRAAATDPYRQVAALLHLIYDRPR